jgi:DNA-binding response OmpR family regulator
MRPTILVVEDDSATRKMIGRALQESGFSILNAGTAAEALHAIREEEPDLVLLDLVLPDADGVNVCREVREFSDVNIMMVTAKRDLTDRLAGLDAGADDYVTKPLAMGELVARIKSQLRRRRMREQEQVETLEWGDLELDRGRSVVHVRGRQIEVTEVEMTVLCALAEAEGSPVTSAELCDMVWGEGEGDPIVLDTHIANIRQKIEDEPGHPRRLVTVSSVAYRLA